MADPLSVLRDFHLAKKDIIQRDDLIIFDTIAFKKTAKTNYLVYGHEEDAQEKDYYTLDCLVFFLKHAETLSHPLYVRKATAENMTVVKRPDRQDLLKYLTGEIDTTKRIDRRAPIELHDVSFKRVAEEESRPATRRPRVENERTLNQREKIVAKFDARKDERITVNPENKASLSQAMDAEKLAALKAQYLNKKRNRIRTDDDVTANRDLNALADSESDGLKEILARERVCRTRNDVTRGPKDLTARLQPIFAMLKAKEEGKKTDAKNVPVKSSFPAAKASSAPTQYSRYDQEQFNKETVTDFGINTSSSYRAAKIEPAKATDNATDAVDAKRTSRVSRTPIIVVPSAPTSMITMYNCKDILEGNVFVDSELKKKSGTKYESEILIQRKKADGTVIPIRVMDNPKAKLNGEDWDRVVAVFVHGPAWQFKDWPWGANIVDILDKVKGFHVKYEEMPVDKNVGSWNVQVVQLSRTKRHLDRASFLKLWENLDKFVLKSKHQLRW